MKKQIKKITTAAAIIPLAVALASLNSSPPPKPAAHGKAAVESSKDADAEESPTTPCPTTLKACPPEGGGDPALNKLKNRLDSPADGDVEPWSLASVVALNEDSPTSWSKKSSRDPLKELGEGTPVSLKGWLINAKPSALETCNCKVSGTANKDFHLNLVRRQDDPMKESVVVEMSPRSRHDGWTLPRLQALVDGPTYVRVTGWLMFDNAPARFQKMPRAS